jgi:hypothetical protein
LTWSYTDASEVPDEKFFGIEDSSQAHDWNFMVDVARSNGGGSMFCSIGLAVCQASEFSLLVFK